jgi:hypothetical protein
VSMTDQPLESDDEWADERDDKHPLESPEALREPRDDEDEDEQDRAPQPGLTPELDDRESFHRISRNELVCRARDTDLPLPQLPRLLPSLIRSCPPVCSAVNHLFRTSVLSATRSRTKPLLASALALLMRSQLLHEPLNCLGHIVLLERIGAFNGRERGRLSPTAIKQF